MVAKVFFPLVVTRGLSLPGSLPSSSSEAPGSRNPNLSRQHQLHSQASVWQTCALHSGSLLQPEEFLGTDSVENTAGTHSCRVSIALDPKALQSPLSCSRFSWMCHCHPPCAAEGIHQKGRGVSKSFHNTADPRRGAGSKPSGTVVLAGPWCLCPMYGDSLPCDTNAG